MFDYNEVVMIEGNDYLHRIIFEDEEMRTVYLSTINKSKYDTVPISSIIRQPDADGYTQVIDPITGRLERGKLISQIRVVGKSPISKKSIINKVKANLKVADSTAIFSKNPVKKGA